MGAGIVLEERSLKASLAGTAFTLPTHIFLALLESEPNHALTGTELESGLFELNFPGYARVEIPLAEWTFTAGTATAKAKMANKAAVTFAECTKAEKRRLAKYIAICDAATAGTQLYTGPLAAEKEAGLGVSIQFAAGEIVIGEE